jgi:signal transduction histidine kinase
MSRLPIRVRLTLAFAVAMALVLAGMGLLVYVRVGDALLASVDQTLRAQAREAVTHARDEHGLVDPDTAAGTTLAQVLDARGAPTRSTPTNLTPLLDPAQAARAAHGSVHTTIRLPRYKGEWRVLAVPSADGTGAVAVARSLNQRDETLDNLLRELLIVSPLALLLASLAGYGLAAAALRPVEAMRARAEGVTASVPAHLPVPRAHDEISRLAVTLNDMLGRLHAAFEHERRFVADASHELRTPLALLRTELELALRRPRSPQELEAAIRSAAEETERLSGLAEDLLTIARADQGSLPLRRRPTDTSELLIGVAGRYRLRAAHLQRTVRANADAAFVVNLDEARVDQALANLVENALLYGAGEVELFAARKNGAVELHVADRGAGFPSEFLERAFDRFSRADEARSEGGAGLGLSIVGLIAEAHGGTAHAANRPGGGADVWVELPAGS